MASYQEIEKWINETKLPATMTGSMQGQLPIKRLKQLTQSLEEDCGFADLLEQDHILVQRLKEMQKVNEATPIAYNQYLVTTQLKSLHNKLQIQQTEKTIAEEITPLLTISQTYTQQQKETRKLFTSMEDELKSLLKTTNCNQIVTSHQQFREELSSLQGQLALVQQVTQELYMSAQDIQNFQNPATLSPVQINRFSRLQKVNQIIKDDQSPFSKSLNELVQQLDSLIQNKLHAQLKEQVQIFESNLHNQEESLALIDVTLRSLKQRKPQEYQHMVDQFVEARVRYMKLNFKETSTILSNSQELPAKKVASLLAWLERSTNTEREILQKLQLDVDRVLLLIFDSSLIKIIKKNIDGEIKIQNGELAQTFQLLQVLMLPMSLILSKNVQEMRLAGLKKFAEAADTSLIKFKSLMYTGTSENCLQLERQVYLYSQMHKKLFEATSQDKELQMYFFKRILMYAITRVFPTVTNRKCLDGVGRDNISLMLLYFKQLEIHCTEWLPHCSKDCLLIEINEMAIERITFLTTHLNKN